MRYSWVQDPVPLMSAAMNPAKKDDFQINASQGFDCSELWTVSHYNSLITYLISFILLPCNYGSPPAFKHVFRKPRYGNRDGRNRCVE